MGLVNGRCTVGQKIPMALIGKNSESAGESAGVSQGDYTKVHQCIITNFQQANLNTTTIIHTLIHQ